MDIPVNDTVWQLILAAAGGVLTTIFTAVKWVIYKTSSILSVHSERLLELEKTAVSKIYIDDHRSRIEALERHCLCREEMEKMLDTREAKTSASLSRVHDRLDELYTILIKK